MFESSLPRQCLKTEYLDSKNLVEKDCSGFYAISSDLQKVFVPFVSISSSLQRNYSEIRQATTNYFDVQQKLVQQQFFEQEDKMFFSLLNALEKKDIKTIKEFDQINFEIVNLITTKAIKQQVLTKDNFREFHNIFESDLVSEGEIFALGENVGVMQQISYPSKFRYLHSTAYVVKTEVEKVAMAILRKSQVLRMQFEKPKIKIKNKKYWFIKQRIGVI